jgi:penicillin G amidase
MSKVATGRVALIILSLATALVIALGLLSYVQLRSSLPRLQGNLKVSGLSASVTIARDAQGVPTVVGRTRSDLVFALGYLHAQERFFQMDAQRTERGG